MLDEAEVRRRLIARFDLRVGPHVGKYVLDRTVEANGAGQPFSVMGGHARTGIAMHMMIDPAALMADKPTSSA